MAEDYSGGSGSRTPSLEQLGYSYRE